jgi:hypothetical protein
MNKQETLEEAAERLCLNIDRPIFKQGAKWQSERSYTKEDIENIWNEFVKEEPPINNGASSDFLVYLKQFKKK